MKKVLNDYWVDTKKWCGSKKLLLTTIVPIILVAVGIFTFSLDHAPTTPFVPAQLSASQPSFATFVEGWNDKARAFDLVEAHELSSTDNKQMLQNLKKYLNGFDSPIANNIDLELQRITQAYPHSIWAKYKDFLTTYTGKKKIGDADWESVSSSDDISQLIKKVTNNIDYDESIKLILASSDPCAFFSLYRYDLYKRGLSSNFKECDASIVDATKYPALAVLIRKK